MQRAAVIFPPLVFAVLVALAPCVANAQSPVDTPFGNANDPLRPVPAAPVPSGKGIVAATLVKAGEAEAAEREKDGKPLAGVVVDVRVDGGSTTPAIDAASVSAELEDKQKVALLASCVPSKDDAVRVEQLFGLRVFKWNVTIEDQPFTCLGGTARMAMLADTGKYHLVAGGTPGQEKSARMVLLFAAPASELRSVTLPGATVAVPPEP